ncbi:MAG: nucleoside triphosphate pyrophosphohydrolase [Erythrobacter sp.]
MTEQLERLLSIMATLRDPVKGCDWDKAQTHASIVPHTIEEAYEVADAVETGDPDELRQELGDLLFQTVFQSRIAEESGNFTFDDVACAICDKLEARHPHIFGDEELADGMTEDRWETLKAIERGVKGADSAMDGVAIALPALIRSQKLQKRAARTGFDWPDPSGPKSKVFEEIEELEAATSNDHKAEEAGDLLFAAVNLVRAYGITAEDALKAANKKFERRFRKMEDLAQGDFAGLTIDQQEQLWQEAKRLERS